MNDVSFALAPWAEEHISDLAGFANNPKIAENLRDGFPYPYTVGDAEAYVKSCIARGESGQLCRAVVINGKAAGSIGVFLRDDVYRKSAELGYWLAEPFWGKGIMTQLIAQICGKAFEMFDIVRIFAEPYADNKGSRRVLEKAGFKLEGVLEKSIFKNGLLRDSCMYALIRNKMGGDEKNLDICCPRRYNM